MFKGRKIAFVFPGQGAQYVGMATDLLAADQELANIAANFDSVHNTNLVDIMQNGPEADLTQTRYTQPAILLHSMAALRAFKKELDLTPDFAAGHSLGEFSALTAAGVFDIADALHLVHKRGEFMIKANQGEPFAMAAILKLSPQAVADICQQASQAGVVVAANFNTPVQTVISGSKAGVEKACELASAQKARAVMLNVGGPFHSPLIANAASWLKQEMETITFKPGLFPVVANVDAKPVTEPDAIKTNLERQVVSSVLWVDSVNQMIADGVETFIEFGPGKVISGMVKKIDRTPQCFSVDKLDDVYTVVQELNAMEAK